MTLAHAEAQSNPSPATRHKQQRLMSAFGKVCAVVSVAATAAVYIGGVQLGMDVYHQYHDYTASVQMQQEAPPSSILAPKQGHMTWGMEAAAFAMSIGAGVAGIAIGKKSRRMEYFNLVSAQKPGWSTTSASFYAGGNNYPGSYDDGFWSGFNLGSFSSGGRGGSWSSGGGSSNKDAAAALLAGVAIAALAAAAASSAVVSYKSVKINFSKPKYSAPVI